MVTKSNAHHAAARFTPVVFTDDNRVAAVKAQQQAAEAAQAKAAACNKSFWCRGEKWADDHADLIGAIASAVAGVVAGAICTVASGGTFTLGCAVLAGAIGGAVSGAVTHGLDVSAGRVDGGPMGWVSVVGTGGAGLLQRAATGALTRR